MYAANLIHDASYTRICSTASSSLLRNRCRLPFTAWAPAWATLIDDEESSVFWILISGLKISCCAYALSDFRLKNLLLWFFLIFNFNNNYIFITLWGLGSDFAQRLRKYRAALPWSLLSAACPIPGGTLLPRAPNASSPLSNRILVLVFLVDSFFTGARDDIPCENSQHTSRASSSFSYPYVQEDNVVLRYSFMKLTFLLEHLKLKGNLSSALEKHVFFCY
jgi:hypothetical protein